MHLNIVRHHTATTGTGTITLGAAVQSFLTVAQAGGVDGATYTYCIEDPPHREIGRGVYTASGTTLTRDVLNSTNNDDPINLSGNAQVFVTVAASDLDSYVDAAGAVTAIKADADWNASDWDTAFGWGNHASAGYITATSTDTLQNKTINTSNNTITVSLADVSDSGAAAAAGVKNSVEIDTGDIQLVGDSASPGNNKVYSTDGSGNKVWRDDWQQEIGDIAAVLDAINGESP